MTQSSLLCQEYNVFVLAFAAPSIAAFEMRSSASSSKDVSSVFLAKTSIRVNLSNVDSLRIVLAVSIAEIRLFSESSASSADRSPILPPAIEIALDKSTRGTSA